MQNKTCWDCRHFDGRYNLCAVTSDFCTVEPDYSACDDFEQKQKPTNGDLIRKMSNAELATWGMYDLGSCPTYEKKLACRGLGCDANAMESCWLNWLNAPAGKDNNVPASRPAEEALKAEVERLKSKLTLVEELLIVHRDHSILSSRQDGKAYRAMNEFMAHFCNGLIELINTDTEKGEEDE